MLKTIHVEIDRTGQIHPLEPIPFKLEGRALLTLLESDTNERDITPAEIKGNASRALRLLASPRFQHRPKNNSEEIQRRISAIRDEWNND
ncbi:hypothetical protein [Methylotuvimicrobium sp. KM1]|uniref:hypothetical protein n=1 Tax=Methylotuvimicrobium sp. KM1 TaxID=3377707 RepID=UPI003850E9E3